MQTTLIQIGEPRHLAPNHLAMIANFVKLGAHFLQN